MTDHNPGAASTPAGWYPDPAGGPNRRWWDGTAWTENLETPYTAGTAVAEQKAPEGTDANTPWIWAILLIPVIQTLPLFFIDWTSYLEATINDPTGLSAYSALLSPAYLTLIAFGWIGTALLIVFAYLDWRELKRRGVPQPFHWAWMFLTLVVSWAVYTIGRAVVANKRTGSGLGVMWATIGLLVAGLVVIIWITASIIQQALAIVPFS